MSVNPDKAVFTAAFITLASTTAASVLPPDKGGRGELPSPKQLFGAAFTFMGLGIIADIAPQVAVGLSASIAVTALTFYGVPIADNYFGATTARKGTTAQRATTTSYQINPDTGHVTTNRTH